MRLSKQTSVRNHLRRTLTLLLGASLSVGLGTQSAIAQLRSGDKSNSPPPGRTVPATPASAKSTGKGAGSTAQAPSAPAYDPTVAVATVGNQSIPLGDLAAQCVMRHGEDVLENMINKYLILQALQAQKIEIRQKDVDDEISRTATKFNLSTPMYLKLIEDERHIAPEHYASDIIWPMLALRALSKDKIQVSPQEIDRAFQSEYGPRVQVRMIACKEKDKIVKLHRDALASPESFKTLAKDHSEDPNSASVEGLIPPIRRFMGDDELEEIAFKLQPNQVSNVFEAGEMHVMLQCVRHFPAEVPPAPQMQSIQNRIRSEIEDLKLRETAEAVYTNLRGQASITLVHGKPELQQQYPGIAAIINRQSVSMSQLEQESVKRFGVKVLEGEINRKVVENALNASGKTVTQQDIDAEIARAADYFGFIHPDGRPNVQEWIKNVTSEEGVTMEIYVRDAVWPTVALKKLVEGQVQLSKEDLEKGFDANFGPRAEVLAIVLSNQRSAQEVWELARNNKSEQFFGELAAQYSVEPSSRSNFGKVPPLRRHGGQPNLEKAAFALQPGEISGIVEVNGQYVILRSQGQTTPVVQDFNAVKEDLAKDLMEKKTRIAMDNYLGKLIKETQIANFMDPKKSHASANETRAAVDAYQREAKKK